MSIDSGTVFEWAALGFLIVVAAFGAAFGGTAAVMSARSNGSPDYCFIAYSAGGQGGPAVPSYRLWEHRPWSGDVIAGVFPSFSEVVAASERMGCHLRSAP